MASPLTLTPDEFKKRYGDITAPDSDVLLSLTPEEFNQRYNGKSAPLIEQPPAKPLSLAEKAFKSFGAASAGVIGEPAAAAIDVLGGVDTAAAIRKRLGEVQAGVQREVPELGKEFKFEDLQDPSFYATKGVSVLPALIALVGTGAGAVGVGARGAAGLASRLGAGAKGLKAAKAIGEIGTSALVSRTLEGALEASGTYNQLLNEGVDRDKAADAAAKVFRNNYALTGMDAAQYAAATLKLPPALSKGLVNWAANAVKLGVASGSEGLEELYQGYVAKSAQEYAKGMSSIDGLDAKEFWNYATRAPLWQQEEFVIGSLFGLGFQVGEGALAKYGKTEEELRQAIKRNPQEVIQTLKGQADEQRADNATREQVAQQAFGKKFDDLTDEQKQKIVDKAAEAKTAEEDARIDETLQGVPAPESGLEEISQKIYGKSFGELPTAQRKTLQQRYKTLSEKAQAKKIDDAIAKKVGLKKPNAVKQQRSEEAQPPVAEAAATASTAAERTAPATGPVALKPEVVTPKAESSPSQPTVAPSPVSARAGEEPQPSKGAPPSRARLIAKGIGRDPVRAVFPSDAHAQLFALGSRKTRLKMSGAQVENVARQTGLSPEVVSSIAGTYNDRVREQARGIKEGENFDAIDFKDLVKSKEAQPSKTDVVEKPTHKEFDRAFETFQEVAAKQTGKPVSEQSAAIAEELRARNVPPVIIDELTNPRRALKPRNPESERSATSRPERIARAANPPPTLKPKVDAVAQANVDFRNKEAALLKAREEIKDEIEARGGEVVVDTDTGAMTITLKPGRAKISESDQALIERLRAEAAETGAYSLATVGQGFEVSATPERIADAESLPAGDFKSRALEFLRRNAEAKAAEKVFKQANEDARNDLVDYYIAERVAGKETPPALLGRAQDGTRVEVMARRVRSAAEPDLAVGGRNFPQEISDAKQKAQKKAGVPFIESRKASERNISRAQLRGTFISARDIQNETDHESGTVVAEEPLVVRESQSSYNARPIKPTPNKFTVDVPTISLDDFKGKKVFIFAADRMRVGEYTGLDKNSDIKIQLQGGPLFPFIKQNFGKSGWALSNKKAVNAIANRIANSDGIGLVMLQGDSGVKGSKTFLEILFAEIQHGLKKNDYSQKDFLRLIDEARKKTLAWQRKQTEGSEFKAKSEAADLSSLLRQPKNLNDAKNMLASVTFSLRSKLIDFFASSTNVKEYGIPDINLIIADVNDPIFKGMEYGDVVSAIQFDKNPKIGTSKELGSQEHFSYGIQISGKGLGLFQAPYDVRDILQIEKPKPHAARSAFLRQPVQKIEKKVKRGAFVSEQSEGYQPNRPGDFLFNPEAVFEQKPYEPNYKKRPDATPRTDRLAKEFVDDLGKNRKRGRVYLANAIDASARETGQIGLVRQEIKTTDDLAVVGQVARDPRVEHLRYVLVKDGESIGSYVVGSRLPSATAAFPYASTKEGIAWLNGLMEETGADGYFMLHNHPSGEVDTSGKEDLDVTETVSKGVKGFKGHVIIDSNVYATITREKDGSLKKQVKKKFFGEDNLLVPSLDHPLIGRKAEDANDLMAIGKSVQTPEGWATLVGATPDSRIRGIAEVEEALLQTKGKRRAAVIRKFARDTGSANVFIVADKKFFDANKDTLMKAVELGFITDAVSSNGDSIHSQFPKLRKENVFFGKEIEAGRVVKEGAQESPAIVRESESTYGKANLNRDQFLDLGKMVNDFLQSKEQVAKLSKAEREEFSEILEVLKDYKELSEKAELHPSEKVLLKYAIRDIESPEGKRVIEKVQAALRDNKPIEAGWLDKIAEWTASMYLWRLASVGTSLGSNLFRQLLKYPELKLAAWFNQGVARQTRVERTRFSEEAEKDFRDAWTGEEFKKAARKALDIMQEKPDAAEESKFFEREKVKRKSIGGKKGKFIRAGLNAQAAIDVLFRQPATTAAIARYSFREAAKTSNNRVEQAKKANAIAQNVRRLKALKDAKQEVPEYLEKFEPILAKAESDAEAQTFQSELDGFMKHVSEIRRYPLARIFVPFFNTRMNILLQAYARTPLSAFGSEFRDLGAKYLKKSLTAEEAGKLSDRMAEITLGTAAFLVTTAALYGLSDDDEELITGDFDEKTIGEKPAGWLPNAVRVGDTYVSLKGFEPYATIFTAFGNAASGKKSLPRNAAEALAKAAFSNPMTDELFDIMGSLKDGDADKFFVDMVAGAATPGLLQDISKIVDPTIRQKEGLEDRFKSRVGIPGVSATLPEKIDVFGEDLEPQTSGEKALKALTGVSISKSKEDPARREIRKLGLKHKLDAITHKGVSLEPWEVLALNKSIGDEYHKTVLKLLQNPTYLVADKEARKTKLRSVRKGLIDKQKAIIEKTPYFMARERVAGAQKEALERVKEQLAE